MQCRRLRMKKKIDAQRLELSAALALTMILSLKDVLQHNLHFSIKVFAKGFPQSLQSVPRN